MIKLEVYSDSDYKEILFLFDEFNISNINQDEFSLFIRKSNNNCRWNSISFLLNQ